MATKAYEWNGRGYGRRIAKPAAKLREGDDVAGGKHVFAVGVQAHKGQCVYNCAILVTALSRDEALGKGWRWVRRAYPAGQGFGAYNVFASLPDKITEPDDEPNLQVE